MDKDQELHLKMVRETVERRIEHLRNNKSKISRLVDVEATMRGTER